MKVKLLFCALLLSTGAFAQTAQSKTEEFLGTTLYNQTTPEKLEYLEFKSNNLCKIVEMNDEKISTFQSLDKIPVYNQQKQPVEISVNDFILALQNGVFNPLFLNLKRERNSDTYYRLGNTNKVLVLKAEATLSDEFNKSKN